MKLVRTFGWPAGTDGDLVVYEGQTEVVSGGAVTDYESITVRPGGILEIGGTDDWTYIGCRGQVRIDGIVRATTGTFRSEGIIETFAPDGQRLQADVRFSLGGAGGQTNIWNRHAAGGGQMLGNGGGGAAYQRNGDSALAEAAGAGGTSPSNGSSRWHYARGGAGATQFGYQGTNGGDVGEPNFHPGGGVVAGGGGGGRKGMAGALLYIRCKQLTGIGTLYLNGQSGGAGGKGGNAFAKFPPNGVAAASGGGGGAGGHGGTLVIRTETPPVHSLTFRVEGGSGGAGGAGGSHSPRAPTPYPGSAGESGLNGTVTFI